MTIKPKRSSIRRARPVGVSISAPPPNPEQPIRYDGSPTEVRPTYEELRWYREAAELKLSQYQKLVVDVYAMLDRSPPGPGQDDAVVAAKTALANFDTTIPKIRTKGTAR